jgi:Flp pilus assembly protein TadG
VARGLTERSNGRCQGQRGAAVIEFALILPLLVVLVFGIVEFSIAYNRKQGLHAAAREGARVASLPQTTNSDVISRVQSSLSGVLSASDIQAATITVSPSGSQPCNGAPPGTHVVVTITANDQLDVPLLPSKLLTLTGRGEFLCE